MTILEDPPGLALLCDLDGTVEAIIRDDLNVTPHINIGESFARVVDSASVAKSLRFLHEIREQKAIFDWELNVQAQNVVKSLYFAGATNEDHIVIIGAESSADTLQIYEELMKIQSEQINSLRSAIKTQTELNRIRNQTDSDHIIELSRLNSELVNVRRELTRKNMELKRVNAQKNELLGMASHDLRTPLSHIMMLSEFLQNETKEMLDEEHYHFVDIIHSSSEFMLRLVNDLLDLTAIESGKLELECRPTDLAALAEQNVILNRTLASRKEIALTFTAEANLPPLSLDAQRIEQVLNNLISNAIKFSHPGTAVQVRITKREDHALLIVQDEGIGIPAADQETLFQPFTHSDNEATAGEKSTGLGLAIVHKIVRGHEGHIWVESEVGEGTTFFISLPF